LLSVVAVVGDLAVVTQQRLEMVREAAEAALAELVLSRLQPLVLQPLSLLLLVRVALAAKPV
jgi:hypothetical protein